MNKPFTKTIPALGILAAAIACTYAAQSYAGNLSLADNALEVASGIEPNVFLLTDNSGSMDWEVTIKGRYQGLYFMPDDDDDSRNNRSYIFPNGVHWTDTSSEWGRIIPSEEAVLSELGTTSDPYGVWRVRFSGYNAQYYNPDVTYIPWRGVDSQATPLPFTASTATAALYDAWLPSGDSEDLTQNLADYTAQIPTTSTSNVPKDITVSDYFPARYYTWTDTNSDGTIDATDAHTRVEIKPATSSYVRAAFDDTSKNGRSDCGEDLGGDGSVSCSYAREIQNFANWFTYYRKRDLATKAAISQAIEVTSFARIGMATINDTSSHSVGVASMNASAASGNKKTLLDTLFNQSPTSGGTPLRSNLDKVGLYYTCDGSSGNSDDIFGGSEGCPRLSTSAGYCQQNYAILMTDGFYNGEWDNTTNHDKASDSSDFDGGSFEDDYSKTLADIAMNYYEHDLDGIDSNDLVPITPRDANYYRGTGSLTSNDRLHQHMATYTLAYGVEGTLTSMPADLDAAFAWPETENPDTPSPDTHKVDDLRHAAYNGRGQFMNAANPVALKTSLGEIFSEILEGTGVASAVAFNTQNLKSNSVVFRAFFDTTNNTGDLLAHPIDLSGSVDLSTVIWSASEQLDAKTSFASDSRTIITYDGSDGIPFQWTRLTDTSGGQQDQLNSPSPSNYTRTGPVGKDRLEYLRGQSQYEGSSFDSGEFRVRPANKGKLGDLVHSAPVFVGSPPFTGRGTGVYPTAKPYSTFKSDNLNRNELVYIGGNDGMLHAFDAGSGAEVFSYIPNAIFSNLSDLTRPDYAHKFYVDLTPTVNDAYFPLNSTLDWYTVAVGGLGKGGKGYYAFDLTDPSTFDTEDNAADHVMWEFTEADDLAGSGTINLGYSYSEPLIAMGNTEDGSGNKRWVVIFGNGYNSTAASGNAVLYVLFIDGGLDGSWSAADFIKIDTGVGISTSADGSTPNGLSGVRGVDIDLDGTVDHVYAGDLQGNLYRFDLSSSNKSAWASNTKLLFQATYGVSGAAQPITNQPVVMKHPDKTGFIVLFGTGSWMTDDDATSTDIQSIYGVWDDMSNTPLVTRLSTDSQLIEQSFEDKDDLKEGKTVGSLSSNDVDYINTGSASDQVKGWYIDLDVEDEDGTVQYPGERAVRDFLIRGGLVFVNTVLPKDPTSCGPVAGGFTLGFDPVTGGASSEAVFDLNNDGAFTVTDNIGTIDDPEVVSRIRHDSGTPSDSSFIDNILVTNVSTGTSNGGATSGDVETIKTNTLGSPGTGRFSWRELLP